MSIQGSINQAINTVGGMKSIKSIVSEQIKTRMSAEKARKEAIDRYRDQLHEYKTFERQFSEAYSPDEYESAVKDAKEQGAKKAMAKMAKSGMERYTILYGGMDDGNTKTT